MIVLSIDDAMLESDGNLMSTGTDSIGAPNDVVVSG